jgi:hypothetical protein
MNLKRQEMLQHKLDKRIRNITDLEYRYALSFLRDCGMVIYELKGNELDLRRASHFELLNKEGALELANRLGFEDYFRPKNTSHDTR